MLMAACASFTSCEDDDDNDPKKENNSKLSNEGGNSTASGVIAEAFFTCQEMCDVYKNGKTSFLSMLEWVQLHHTILRMVR